MSKRNKNNGGGGGASRLKTEIERIVSLFDEIGLFFKQRIVTNDMKIFFNLPISERYEVDQVIQLGDSAVLFFRHDGIFLGIGTQDLHENSLGYFIKRKD